MRVYVLTEIVGNMIEDERQIAGVFYSHDGAVEAGLHTQGASEIFGFEVQQ